MKGGIRRLSSYIIGMTNLTNDEYTIKRINCTSWSEYRVLTRQAATISQPNFACEISFYKYVLEELPAHHPARVQMTKFCDFYKGLYHAACTSMGIRFASNIYDHYCVYQYVKVLMEKGDIRFTAKGEWIVFTDDMAEDTAFVYNDYIKPLQKTLGTCNYRIN